MQHVLLATDADWIRDEVVAALGGKDTSFDVVRAGRDVLPVVRRHVPDLVVLDLQIGNMGAIAVTMALRLEASVDRLPPVPTLILLDRRADLFMAQRSGAEGWLLKPLDSLRLRKAARALLGGGTHYEGLPAVAADVPEGEGEPAAQAG